MTYTPLNHNVCLASQRLNECAGQKRVQYIGFLPANVACYSRETISSPVHSLNIYLGWLPSRYSTSQGSAVTVFSSHPEPAHLAILFHRTADFTNVFSPLSHNIPLYMWVSSASQKLPGSLSFLHISVHVSFPHNWSLVAQTDPAFKIQLMTPRLLGYSGYVMGVLSYGTTSLTQGLEYSYVSFASVYLECILQCQREMNAMVRCDVHQCAWGREITYWAITNRLLSIGHYNLLYLSLTSPPKTFHATFSSL